MQRYYLIFIYFMLLFIYLFIIYLSILFIIYYILFIYYYLFIYILLIFLFLGRLRRVYLIISIWGSECPYVRTSVRPQKVFPIPMKFGM